MLFLYNSTPAGTEFPPHQKEKRHRGIVIYRQTENLR